MRLAFLGIGIGTMIGVVSVAGMAACGDDRPRGESTNVPSSPSTSSSGGGFTPETKRPDACEAATVLFLRRFGPGMRGRAGSSVALLAMLAKVAALLSGGRDAYFASYGQDGLNGIGTKAAMVGWLLAEAEKSDLGLYAKADAAFLTDLADGAGYNVDLVGVYGRPDYVFAG